MYEMQTEFSLNNSMFYGIGNIPVDLSVRGCSRFPLRRELHSQVRIKMAAKTKAQFR